MSAKRIIGLLFITGFILGAAGCILNDTTPPTEISHIRINSIWNKSCILAWDNPAEYDFKEVEINFAAVSAPKTPILPYPDPPYMPLPPLPTSLPPYYISLPAGTSQVTLSFPDYYFPKNEQEYIITFKTRDYALNLSKGVSFTVIPIARVKKISHYDCAVTPDPGVLGFSEIHDYLPNGLTEKVTRFDPNGNLTFFDYYENNSESGGYQITTVTRYNPSTIGPPLRENYRKYDHDAAGLLRLVTAYDTNDVVLYTENYTYDDTGHASTYKKFAADGTTELVTKTFTYDPDFRIVSITQTTGKVVLFLKYAYDADGNTQRIDSRDTNASGKIEEYDKYEDYITE